MKKQNLKVTLLCITLLYTSLLTSNLNLFKTSNIFLISFFCVFFIVCIKDVFFKNIMSEKTIKQLVIICVIMLLFWDIPVLFDRVKTVNKYIYVTGFISIHLSLIFWGYKCFKLLMKTKFHIKEKIYENRMIIILTIFLIILSLENFNCLFKGDSNTYYQGFIRNLEEWNYSINNLYVFQNSGHISYAYSVLLYIGYCIWPTNGFGIHFVNLIISMLSVYCIWGILRKTFYSFNNTLINLLVLLFIVSPMFSGISYAFNLDFAMLNFIIWLIYCTIYDFKIFQMLSGVALCYSKEPGIVIYAMFLFGNWMINIINEKDKITRKTIKKVIRAWPWLLTTFLCAGATSLLMSNSGWGKLGKELLSKESKSMSKITWDVKYIYFKLEQMFVINFAWILLIIMILAAIVILYKYCREGKFIKLDIDYKNLVLIFSTYIGFLAINFFFFTYMHYRYIQPQVFYEIIIVALCIEILFYHKKYAKNFLIGWGILLFVECYIVIDPISLNSLHNVYTGNTRTISTRRIADIGKFVFGNDEQLENQWLNEGLIYNRQQLGIEAALEEALFKINYNQNDLIVIPNIFGAQTARCILGGETYEGYFWDKKKKQISYNDNDMPITFCYDNELKTLDTSIYDNIYYLMMDYQDNYDLYSHIDESSIKLIDEINKRTWNLKIVEVVLEKQ